MFSSSILSHCTTLVRAYDHDRYLCALFAPASIREAWIALFAFNHEIAVIPDMVSEEMIGFMRFAWWREALDEIYAENAVRRHPVVEALAEIIITHHLPRALFDSIIDARETQFAGQEFTELSQWETYFRATSLPLFFLCAQIARVPHDTALETLGIAWGYIGMARVCDVAKDENNAALLWKAGEEKLRQSDIEVHRPFQPFRNTMLFYLKKHARGKAGRESAFALALTLCRKHFFNKE